MALLVLQNVTQLCSNVGPAKPLTQFELGCYVVEVLALKPQVELFILPLLFLNVLVLILPSGHLTSDASPRVKAIFRIET